MLSNFPSEELQERMMACCLEDIRDNVERDRNKGGQDRGDNSQINSSD